MNVTEATIMLAEAELKQVSVKDDTYTVLGYINLGILELHKRFPLRKEKATITVATGVTRYKLDGIDANVAIDLSNHDVLLIEAVNDAEGYDVSMHDKYSTEGVMSPEYHTVEVKDQIAGTELTVYYRAAPKFLTSTQDVIPLPPQYIEALFNYVGYRGHGSVTGDIKTENNTHYMRFEKSCNTIEAMGLILTEDLVSYKFGNRGFV